MARRPSFTAQINSSGRRSCPSLLSLRRALYTRSLSGGEEDTCFTLIALPGSVTLAEEGSDSKKVSLSASQVTTVCSTCCLPAARPLLIGIRGSRSCVDSDEFVYRSATRAFQVPPDQSLQHALSQLHATLLSANRERSDLSKNRRHCVRSTYRSNNIAHGRYAREEIHFCGFGGERRKKGSNVGYIYYANVPYHNTAL